MGIEIITAADYVALGQRPHAFLQVPPTAAIAQMNESVIAIDWEHPTFPLMIYADLITHDWLLPNRRDGRQQLPKLMNQ
jgi:hypothetical protein